jgi:hypothetical protein
MTAVVMVAGSGEVTDEAKAEDADEVLVKPVNVSTLILAVDLSRSPREFQANTMRDKDTPYLQRANERSANAASHRIVMQRLFRGHIRHLQSGLHWLN